MAEEITGSRYQPGRGPVGGEREVRDRLLRGSRKRRYRESEGVRGGPLLGDFWSGSRLWKAVAKEITGSRCLPARGPVRGERSAPWSVANRRREAEGSKAEDRACSTLLHRLFVRIPKATLESLRAYGEDLFRVIFGLELDCGKLWRRKSLGAGINPAEDPWEVRGK